MNTAGMLPLLEKDALSKEIEVRVLLLNCLTKYYAKLWNDRYNDCFTKIRWSKIDGRLDQFAFKRLEKEWNEQIPLRTAFERRQAMVEIDVLVAMTLGMSLEQLKVAYRVQFPTLQQHERDTYYDANGRIVYAKNNALTNVGVSRTEFEGDFKAADKGQVFTRTFVDNTMPGGPVERTIEYVAPFDRCDREQDYETAWKFFEEKYGRSDN